MQENYPVLISCKPLKTEYEHLNKIYITCENFTLGRGIKNSAIVPFLAISRNHCIFKKNNGDEWYIEDVSSLGIEVNGRRLGKGVVKKLSHEDIITLEPSHEFLYKFVDPSCDDFEIPRKRIKLEEDACNDIIINNVKMKFEESQSYEIKQIEEKIQNAKQMQTTSMILKQQLQLDMNRKMQQLESDFALQIENLKGEKNEVERQKAFLLEERDTQLATVKQEMEGKISDLMASEEQHLRKWTELTTRLKDALAKQRQHRRLNGSSLNVDSEPRITEIDLTLPVEIPNAICINIDSDMSESATNNIDSEILTEAHPQTPQPSASALSQHQTTTVQTQTTPEQTVEPQPQNLSCNNKKLKAQILRTEHLNKDKRAEELHELNKKFLKEKHAIEIKILKKNLQEAKAKAELAQKRLCQH